MRVCVVNGEENFTFYSRVRVAAVKHRLVSARRHDQ